MTPKEAQAKLDQIRALVNADDDGPEGSMGPRWILGQVQEILGGTDAHPRRASSAIWEEMLAEIGRLRREADRLRNLATNACALAMHGMNHKRAKEILAEVNKKP